MQTELLRGRVEQALATALAQLGAGPAVSVPTLVDVVADVVVDAMGQPGRVFHTVHHALALVSPSSPIQTLAALFHDLVYLKLDDGFPAAFQAQAARLFELENAAGVAHAPAVPQRPVPTMGIVRLRLTAAAAMEAMCATVFGFAEGAELRPEQGLNEFASALLAARYLADALSVAQLLAVFACIEASIPFRARVDHDPGAALRDRLQQANIAFGAGLDTAGVAACCAVAADFANCDVKGFAAAEPSVFLRDTLLLIEENARVALRQGRPTPWAYRQAMAAMHDFLVGLAPSAVFRLGEVSTVGLAAPLADNLRLGGQVLKLMLLSAIRPVSAVSAPSLGSAEQITGDVPAWLSDPLLVRVLHALQTDCAALMTCLTAAQACRLMPYLRFDANEIESVRAFLQGELGARSLLARCAASASSVP